MQVQHIVKSQGAGQGLLLVVSTGGGCFLVWPDEGCDNEVKTAEQGLLSEDGNEIALQSVLKWQN